MTSKSRVKKKPNMVFVYFEEAGRDRPAHFLVVEGKDGVPSDEGDMFEIDAFEGEIGLASAVAFIRAHRLAGKNGTVIDKTKNAIPAMV